MTNDNIINRDVSTSLKRAWAIIYESKQLRLLVVFSLLANFFFGVIITLNPAIVKALFQESDQKLSLLYTIAGVVTIGTLSFISFLNRYLSVEKIGIVGIILFLGSALFLSKQMTINYISFFIRC